MTATAVAPCAREKLVTITVGPNGITVNPNTFHVSKGRNEEVLWICDVDFTVDFAESPFNDTEFNRKYPFSGLVGRKVEPSKVKRYKYTVSAGGRRLDPDGQVDD